jgi:hypothetical protein
MADSHPAGAHARGRPLEKRETRVVRRVFERRPGITREGGDVGALHINRERELRGQTPAECLVAIGLVAAQLMVEMGGAHEMKSLVAGDVAHHPQERDRIGPAGERDSHTIARLE